MIHRYLLRLLSSVLPRHHWSMHYKLVVAALQVLEVLKHNISLNNSTAEAAQLDWYQPGNFCDRQIFDLALAADVLYVSSVAEVHSYPEWLAVQCLFITADVSHEGTSAAAYQICCLVRSNFRPCTSIAARPSVNVQALVATLHHVLKPDGILLIAHAIRRTVSLSFSATSPHGCC